jgi:cyclic-di-AMP phosphodiesterase PgpH
LDNREDELHRSPTRFERFRGWVEGLPKVRLYFALVLISWISLTALIALGARPPLERAVAQGLMEGATLAQLEQLNLWRSWNPWKALLGVALVVALEMGMAWYFMERFGKRILKTNVAIRVVLAASLMILFTALARFFIELDFNPYLTPLAGLPIFGTMLLGPRLMFLMVVITCVNVGIMSGNNFLTAALLLISGFAIYAVARVESRQALLKAGLVIAVFMATVTSAVSLVGAATFARRCGWGCWGLATVCSR